MIGIQLFVAYHEIPFSVTKNLNSCGSFSINPYPVWRFYPSSAFDLDLWHRISDAINTSRLAVIYQNLGLHAYRPNEAEYFCGDILLCFKNCAIEIAFFEFDLTDV